ncbi:MAG: nuclear transport factor 2 family protein [Lysobacteraceae bacterium]
MTRRDAKRQEAFLSSPVRARQRPSSFRAALWPAAWCCCNGSGGSWWRPHARRVAAMSRLFPNRDAAIRVSRRASSESLTIGRSAQQAKPMSHPQDVVQRQLDAYNARDLERFLAEYAEDVRVFRPPAVEPVLSGKQAFGAHYASNRFALPHLHARLVARMVSGNIVVDHEDVTGLSEGHLSAVAVYEVVDGRIKTVWFF